MIARLAAVGAPGEGIDNPAALDERPRQRCSLLRRNRSIPISKGGAWLIQRFTAHMAMVAVLLATVVG